MFEGYNEYETIQDSIRKFFSASTPERQSELTERQAQRLMN
ncbi:hypothetical protein N7V53_01455 [Kosakonia sp. HypNH10]|nr:hypothetical protein [Kosakonia sp. HypNH10]MDH2911204.1 hypothetical protein [Kosakonia sp. HypNH10]